MDDSNMKRWDLRLEEESERLTPSKDLKEVQIGHLPHKSGYLALLKKNIDLFAWALSNMFGIDTKVMCHRLAIDASVKPMSHRKCKDGEEKRTNIDEKVQKMENVIFIT